MSHGGFFIAVVDWASSKQPSPSPVNSLPSLQVALSQALQPLMADLADQGPTNSPASTSAPRQSSTEKQDRPYPALRFSRDRTTIAYLCRPAAPDQSRSSADLAVCLLSRWQTAPATQPPLFPLSAWVQPHTLGAAWPTGQLLLTPQPLALAGWLWQWASLADYGADPGFDRRSDVELDFGTARHPEVRAEPASLLPQQFSLAQRLQLSPLALLQYTQARCHHLAHGSPAATLFGQTAIEPSETWVVATPQGQMTLRALAKFTDDLATTPAPTPHGLAAGLDLCAAVDRWLRTICGSQSVADGLLLAAIAHSLDYVLRHWLRANAPKLF